MLSREDFAFLPGDKGVSPLAPQGQFWASSSVSHLVCLFREAAGCRAPGLARLIDTCCTPSGKRTFRQQVGLGHCRASNTPDCLLSAPLHPLSTHCVLSAHCTRRSLPPEGFDRSDPTDSSTPKSFSVIRKPRVCWGGARVAGLCQSHPHLASYD